MSFQPARPVLLVTLAILFALSLSISAQEAPASAGSGELQTAKIVSVLAHEEGRAFDWLTAGLALVPVYDGYAFYDLTIELNRSRYIVRYESQTGYYPAAWKPGSTVQVRVGRGRLYLLRYDGEQVPASIVRRESLDHP